MSYRKRKKRDAGECKVICSRVLSLFHSSVKTLGMKQGLFGD